MNQRTTRKPANRPDPRRAEVGSATGQNDPAPQGEGNYTAARRHRASAEHFIDSGKVAPAARDAAPRSDDEARDLREAEQAGRAHARK